MEIFRFVQARPAVDVQMMVPLRHDAPIAKWMKTEYWEKKQRPDRAALSERFAKQHKAGLGKLVSDAKLNQLLTVIEEAAKTNPTIDPKWFGDTTLAIFGVPLSDLLASADFVAKADQISDTLLVSKLVGVRLRVEEAILPSLLRVIHLLHQAAENYPGLKTREYVTAVLTAPIVLPSSWVLFADLPGAGAAAAEAEAHRARRLAAAAKEREQKLVELFGTALDELGTATAADHELGPPVAGAPFTYMALTAAFSASKPGILQAVKELNVPLATTSAPDLADKLLQGLQRATDRLASLMPEGGRLTRVGSQWVSTDELGFVLSPDASSMPTDDVSAARPVGIADLLVVKQKIKQYEPGEIAHIENCLVGELRRRSHERTDRLEVETLTEVETTKEEERDLQTTDKAELKQEAEQIVKSDNSVNAGMSLSASYGAVTLSTNLSSSSSTAQQDARRQANAYSKEVVSRAVSRTMERTLSRRTEKKLFQIVETNLHEFNSKDKDVTGVYRWVNKVYDAQVYNYGRRMLYEIVVPEPAAFFKQSLAGAKAEGATLVKPQPIDFQPSDLDDGNWTKFAARYRLGTATPPPKPYVTVAVVYAKSAGGPNETLHDAQVADIPEGFYAFTAMVRVTASYFVGHSPNIDITVGTQLLRYTTTTSQDYLALEDQVGKIPTSYVALNISGFSASIEIKCKRTDEAIRLWQIKLFGELMTAYNCLLAQFEGELDRQRQQDEAQPYARNPLADERIVRGELRKSALTLIRRDNFTGFDALKEDPLSKGPYPDVAKADTIARSILFFEQAFEWEQMTYRFYEYFWGRKQQWKKDLLLDDRNEEFRSFLSAGSARLILPVRPGFEKLVAHYFETGIIANGDDIPDVTSAEYLPILTEIKEELKAPGEEKLYGAAWPVTVPTSLVILKSGESKLML